MKRDINDILHDLLIGSLDEEGHQQLRRWFGGNADRQRQYEQLLEADDFSEKYQLYHSIDTRKSWQRFSHRHGISVQSSTPSHFRRIVLYAASVAVLLVCMVTLWRWSQRPERPEMPQQVTAAIRKAEVVGKNQAIIVLPDGSNVPVTSDSAAQAIVGRLAESQSYKIVTRNDREFWMTLTDGTRIHLAGGSTLRCPVCFGDDRTVHLDGNAFFYVAKDKSHPFMVKTASGIVKEYGTSFNVSTTEKPGATQVVLVEGSISVITRSGNEHAVKPHQMAEIHQKDDNVKISATDVAPYTAWNEGRFVFEDCPMQQLIQVLAAWYDLEVRFRDDTARDIRFTGAIDKYGNADEILRAIESVTNVSVSRHGHRIDIE